VALAPREAIKLRIQTQDNWADTLRKGLPKFYGKKYFYLISLLIHLLPFLAEEGIWG
jgi:hypothetical protein